MKKYNLVNENLTEGQKITLVFQSEFGGMVTVKTTYFECKTAPHYQSCPSDMIGVQIKHKPKGKRLNYYSTIRYNIPLVIYDGWQEIDTESIIYNQISDTTKQSKYTMHDNRYFTDLLTMKPDNIIFSDIA